MTPISQEREENLTKGGSIILIQFKLLTFHQGKLSVRVGRKATGLKSTQG